MDTAVEVGLFSWHTEKVNICLLPKPGVEHEVQDFSGGGAVEGGGFFDADQVYFGEDVVGYSARVLGAVLDEM